MLFRSKSQSVNKNDMEQNKFYRGKAFVVGNDHYDQMKPDLDNAVNDAKAIHNTFQTLGFLMMPEAYDIDVETFDSLFEIFKSDLNKFDVGILYFSGHGVEIEGKNYLIMKNTPMTDLAKTTIRYSVDLQSCLNELHHSGCKMIVVIIDACRDNPFEGKERGWGSVNLAPVFAPKGTMIAYSTSPGERAFDFGMKGHSVYTGALLAHLKEEGLEIETFFKKVRSTVNAMTGGKKTSWEHTSLIGTFSFNSGKMVHIQELGYDVTAIRDKDFSTKNRTIGNIISDLRSYNWYKQNDAIIEFEALSPKTIDKNDLFVVGRNLLQSAIGGSYNAQEFLKDANKLSKYTLNKENHLFNGVLFEIYFNRDGQFRYKAFKATLLDDLIKHANNNELSYSFEFINNVIKPFSHYLIYVPSKNPNSISINIKIENGKVQMPWGEENNITFIKSISFDGFELIADENEINVLSGNAEWEINKSELEKLLAIGYAIPSTKLKLIFNEDIGHNKVWFNKKLKSNFRQR